MQSKIIIADRKKKYPKLGGPRKYPSKYVWQLNNNKLEIVVVRYFVHKGSKGYYFFKYENMVTTRGKYVPSDLKLYKSRDKAFKNIPGINIKTIYGGKNI